ncbi:hypothetical protein HPP92_003773 [Vanilla planifolia]|uniref:Ent-kaurene synthase n=1 Tax=Vanilla planifolia TaxID=51239 RepID=A0A835SCJ3_VANPL|nr:hypothetical protein HPP92_003773 [Vanilla planifolia]
MVIMNSLGFSPIKCSFVGVQRSSRKAFSLQRNTEVAASLDKGLKNSLGVEDLQMGSKGLLDGIRERLFNIELSASFYDTAWVTMVPSPRFAETPCFPQCLDWILDNQHPDGSWGPPGPNLSAIKDVLSSTLACVLALKRWNVGEEYVKKGLWFIGTNFSSCMNEKFPSPIGFSIIYPGMINLAIEMGLKLPVPEVDIDAMLSIRESALRRETEKNSAGSKAYLAFVAEGLPELQDWGNIMNYQGKNGSLFNSPSTTAAALTHVRDDKALNYLSSLLEKFGCSVPTIYPLEIRTQLSMVDRLERLGLSQYFVNEIGVILDRVYSCWIENDEEVYSDIITFAMAFRILRMHGYDVSSDALCQFDDARHFDDTLQGHIKDLHAVMELHKASHVHISPKELVLMKLNSWTTHFLKRELNDIKSLDIAQEVDYALRNPLYATLERLEHKRNIEQYNLDSRMLLKTSYVPTIMNNNSILKFAVDAFCSSQVTYSKELQYLESWVKENRLDQLSFSRQKQTYCYLSAAATLFSPELSNARICWAKGGVLSTVVDDFFDGGGSVEELENLISLVEKWHDDSERCCSANVKIIFSALYNTINELGEKASLIQKRDVTDHLIRIWLDMMKAMMKETKWLKNDTVPMIDEYMTNAIPSFALGTIILPSIYFVGPEVSEETIESPEYKMLFELVSRLGRLLNDIQGFERDRAEGKLNSISLLVLHSNTSISEEEAKKQTRCVIDSIRGELLGLVLQKGGMVPKACKELFWKMSKILHLFYKSTDGFSSPKEMVDAVHAVVHEPLKVGHLLSPKA